MLWMTPLQRTKRQLHSLLSASYRVVRPNPSLHTLVTEHSQPVSPLGANSASTLPGRLRCAARGRRRGKALF
eukprot:scaffold774_cov248-Pinguiococcus_pyrenoidosus.AAC.3